MAGERPEVGGAPWRGRPSREAPAGPIGKGGKGGEGAAALSEGGGLWSWLRDDAQRGGWLRDGPPAWARAPSAPCHFGPARRHSIEAKRGASSSGSGAGLAAGGGAALG